MSQRAEEFFRAAISDPEHPLVMFAVGWCEFCWAVRKLFAAMEVPFRAIDLDAEEFEEDDHGEKVRELLTAYTGSPTIPQVFIAGRFIGGATDTIDAYRKGTLQEELKRAGLEFKDVPGLDPYHFRL